MPAAKRKAISKRLRFLVFARDEYTCRYCGECPPKVKLVIDHIEPVSKGGANEETNLIAACEACNQGKGSRRLGETAPTDTDKRRLAQEHLEQLDLAKIAARARKARSRLRAEILGAWIDETDSDVLDDRHLSLLVGMAVEFEPPVLIDWIASAYRKVRTVRSRANEDSAIRYICGIARNVRLEGRS